MVSEDPQTSGYYDRKARELAAAYEKADVTALHSQILAWMPAKGRILDVGCGSGREAAFLFNQGREVLGLDGSLSMLKSAIASHKELKGRLFQCEIGLSTNLPVLASSLDGILAIAFLMHLSEESLKQTLSEFSRTLKPGGRLFVSVPEKKPGVQSNRDENGRFFLMKNLDFWRDRLSDSGFSIEAITSASDGLGRQETLWVNLAGQKKEPVA